MTGQRASDGNPGGGPILALVRELVMSLTDEIRIRQLCDEVVRLVHSKGLPAVKRATILTNICRCIANRDGSHYNKRVNNLYNPNVDLLWEVRRSVVRRLDPENHLGLKSVEASEAMSEPEVVDKVKTQGQFFEARLPRKSGKNVVGRVLETTSPDSAGDKQAVPVDDSLPPNLVSGGDDNSSVDSLLSAGFDHEVVPIPVLPWTRLLVQALTYHEKKLRFLSVPPNGLQAQEWLVDAVLTDERGRLVLLVVSSDSDSRSATAITKALQWGLGHVPPYPDVRLVLVLRTLNPNLSIMRLVEGLDRVSVYSVGIGLKPLIVKDSRFSGGK